MRRALAAALLLLPACGGAPAPSERPHVVLLLADDLGYGDVSFLGGASQDPPPLQTPRLDALAAEGVVLERFYAASMCSPSRAGLLTGRSPLTLGMVGNVRPRHEAGLPAGERTLAELFRAAGYETALVGKWHLGDGPGQRPRERGFERFYGFLGGFVDYFSHARNTGPDWWRDGEQVVEPGHATRLFAREAVRRIHARDPERPLFLVGAFSAPHAPLQPPPDAPPLPEGPGRARAAYEALVRDLDRAAGQVLDALAAAGIADETLVVFASDNGADPAQGGDNGPLAGGKYTVLEGGVRVPAVLRLPGALPAGARRAFVVDHTDLLPTLCRAAGVDIGVDTGATRPLDGLDLWDALRTGAEPPERTLAFAARRRALASWGLLRGRWKLVEDEVAGGGLARALYDLAADPAETRDVATEHPDLTAELAAELARRRTTALAAEAAREER